MEAKFCMSCGAAMETRDVDGTERSACTACSFVHWGNYSIGVGALVMKDEKILLVRRAQEPGKGRWTNPGGYIEQGLVEDREPMIPMAGYGLYRVPKVNSL